MLRALTRLAIRAPRRVILVALGILIGTAIFSIPVAASLSPGGFQDPASESMQGKRILADEFGQGDTQLLITVQSGDGVTGRAARAAGTDIVRGLQAAPFVATVSSPWTSPPAVAQPLISADGTTGVIVAGVTGDDKQSAAHAEALTEQLVHDRDGVTVRAGGEATIANEIRVQTEADLKVMEAIAVPLSFLVLVWVFGGLVAAALPVAVGVFAIFGALAVLRVITSFTDVSIFALNLCAAMGLALAIDYTLLILSRYREELAGGSAPEDALLTTMATAGRTVLFSALTVALSISTLVLFPTYFLRSFAYAGIAVLLFASAAAIVVTPAAITLLGPRLDSLDIRGPLRRLFGRSAPLPQPIEQTFWYRLCKFAMRWAVPVGLAIIVALTALGLPFLGVKGGMPDDRVLPGSASARQVGEQLRGGFTEDLSDNITVVLPDAAGLTEAELGRYAADLSRVADVSSVSAPAGTFVAGARVGPPAGATALTETRAFLTVASHAPLFSPESEAQLDGVHAVPGPGGRAVLVTGSAQLNRDTAGAVTSRMPLVAGVIAAITFVLLFLLTGSVVVPLKALVLNVLSLSAAFGALVWIFQDGHLGGLGTVATGTLVISIPVLLFCIAFGLSMDYEVFLLARIHEYWVRSGRTSADNDESVALGLTHTARVITAAALIMSISFAALIAADVSFMRMFGLGLALAVLADATLVRMLLVPAFMHVMGRFNWWAPRPLARLHDRIGISESG